LASDRIVTSKTIPFTDQLRNLGFPIRDKDYGEDARGIAFGEIDCTRSARSILPSGAICEETRRWDWRKFFAELEDPRTGNVKQHLLHEILVIALRSVCAAARVAPTWRSLAATSAIFARLCLGLPAVADKSNEIAAVPKLSELLCLNGCIVTAEAMSCQRKIARQVVERRLSVCSAS
jgi:hypothetical protein